MNTAFKLTDSDLVTELRLDEDAQRWSPYADAAEVAARLEPEAPTFCFSADALQRRAEAFVAGFPGEVAYAVKANSGPDIILTLAACGISCFDVASIGEMAHVRSLVPRARLHYHNPVKSRTEIARAHGLYGCRRFAADDPAEVAKLAEVIGDTGTTEIAVRFRLTANGASAHDFSSKFGATPEEAIELLRAVAAAGFVPVLTFHPGSQCLKPEAYARHIAEAARITAESGVTVATLNVGGGFPGRYLACAVPPLEAYFAAITAAVERDFGTSAPRLECEPGRGMVAPAISLLTRIKLVKHGRREVFINDGIYGALMEMSQEASLMPRYRAIRNGAPLAAERAAFTVYGPTCDPIDRLPRTFELPVDIAEDDYIEFDSLGAYGAATGTRFNGYETKDTVPVLRIFAGE